ncbi:MAG: RNA-directed DNA polymerase [Chitinophagaceae bacterium]|nr:RNA-directed DNA polymerase [Chitinophagaceae bacterium]
MAQGLTRQQLYDKIRLSSKDEVILQEMTRLGFWSKDSASASPSALLIEREDTLRKELTDLLKEKQKYANQEKLLAEMRAVRMEKALKKRQETKLRKEEQRKERAEEWAEQKNNSILYLGENVSAGLHKIVSDVTQLQKYGLPVWHDVNAMAAEMGLGLGEIRFLAFNRKVAHCSHYQHFYLPKKSGGKRLISAPMPRLKAVQNWILHNILYRIKNSDAAHGFVPGRSIVTNATPHVGKELVINIDLRDFFPSVAYKRVKGLFVKLGYSEQLATILGLLCTEPDVDEIVLDNRKYYVAKTERHLPQGAQSSPAITNLICYKLDKRFEGLAARHGYSYTRYADDMTFSANGEGIEKAGQLMAFVKKVIKEEGFTIHPEKLRVMRKGDKREVTGVVVNDKLSIDRETLRKFRALLHQISKTGLSQKQWGNGNIVSSLQGYANYVAMVKPGAGAKLKASINELFNRPEIKREAVSILGDKKE